jgi:hypothetical protein
VFCFNVLFVYLVVYVICIVLTLPRGGKPTCSTVMIINNNNNGERSDVRNESFAVSGSMEASSVHTKERKREKHSLTV